MATLGRKAMKRTLKRLKEDAVSKTKQCYGFMEEMIKLLDEEGSRMNGKSQAFLQLITMAQDATTSLLRYIQALEDYGYELDEEWEKLLESIKQAKSVEKKEGSKEKPFYVK